MMISSQEVGDVLCARHQLPPIVTAYVTIVQYQNQKTDIGTIQTDLIFHQFYMLVCMCSSM